MNEITPNAPWALKQLPDWFVLVWVPCHSDMSSEVLQDVTRENPKTGHRIMSWMLQNQCLQNALMCTAVFEASGQLVVAAGRRSAMSEVLLSIR